MTRHLRPALALAALVLARPALADCTVLWSVDPDEAGTVFLPDREATDVAVVVDGERIAAVGTPEDLGLAALEGSDLVRWGAQSCALVDLSGRSLTSGLVAAPSALGLVEVSMESATRDDDGGGDPVRAAIEVDTGYNPRSTLIPVARAGGITSSLIAPGGGLVAGQSAWVDLVGTTRTEAVQQGSVAMHASLPGPSLTGALLQLRELFDDARLYGRDPGAYDQNRVRSLVASRLDLEAMQPVLRGEIPLVVRADRASDIEALITFAGDEGIRLVLYGGAEAWVHRDALAAADVAVVVDPLVYGAGGFDQVRGRPDNPALLVEAGVRVVLTAWSSHNAREVRQSAGNAVRGGMDHRDALASITSVPAEVFGIADHGLVAVGQVANLVVWRSVLDTDRVDPLETTTGAERVFVHGHDLPLVSRQSELFERYRELPGTPLPPLSLPDAP